MVIVERKRIPNKNKQFTELHNIWNENLAPQMSYSILRVFKWTDLISFYLSWIKKENLGFSQIQRTEFWSPELSGHHKIPTRGKKTENLETVTETCPFLSVPIPGGKLPVASHHCVTTVTEIWQKYSEFHRFSTCFVGNTGWNSRLQNSNLCVLICQWSLTEKTHPDVQIWLVEVGDAQEIRIYTHNRSAIHIKSKKYFQHFASVAYLKISITTKLKNTQEHWLGTSTLLLFRNTHTGNHTYPQTKTLQSPFSCNPTLNEVQEWLEYSKTKIFEVSRFYWAMIPLQSHTYL